MHIKLKRNPFHYQRDLPHIQKSDRTHFITFTTYERWKLVSNARDIVMESLLFHDTKKLEVLAAVVMPDHAHLVCVMMRDTEGEEYLMSDMMRSIKSYSAHAINKCQKRKGHVWLDESFDHVVRHEEGIDAKIDYVKMNPVRAGLVKRPEDYPWLYAEDMVDWKVCSDEEGKPLPALQAWKKMREIRGL